MGKKKRAGRVEEVRVGREREGSLGERKRDWTEVLPGRVFNV